MCICNVLCAVNKAQCAMHSVEASSVGRVGDKLPLDKCPADKCQEDRCQAVVLVLLALVQG